MVDGSFDPLHDGHVRYFAVARSTGLPVFCNVATDEYTSTKHKVLLPREARVFVLNALRDIDYVYSSGATTRDVLEILRPKIYLKGQDWELRGGVPHEELRVCQKNSIQIEYAREQSNSSSRLLNQFFTSGDGTFHREIRT